MLLFALLLLPLALWFVPLRQLSDQPQARQNWLKQFVLLIIVHLVLGLGLYALGLQLGFIALILLGSISTWTAVWWKRR